MREGHRTVSRVVRILEMVSRTAQGMSLAEISHALDAPRSTTYGFVRGLEAEGYLAEIADQQRFVLGVGAHTLLASSSTSLVELVLPVMQDLNRDLDETVTLAVPVGKELAYIHSLRSSMPINYSPVMQSRRDLWPTSSGKVFLAFGARGSLPLRKNPDELFGPGASQELNRIRKQGWATNIGESVTGVAAVAVGVKIAGQLVAAISIGGPRARFETHLEDSAEMAQQLLRIHEL